METLARKRESALETEHWLSWSQERDLILEVSHNQSKTSLNDKLQISL
jgi:hypothetical protein